MVASIQIAVLLLIVVAAVALAARRIGVPPAILLVIVGVALALVPGLPHVQLVPELVLLLVLPPLIYSAGVAMSWREFRFNLRPISLLAFGCVVFTTATVAGVAHGLFGMSWAAAFVLGAIISPPDVVAPLAIARRLGLPRRLLVILEGEGLANDATALILYRFAVVAVSTGSFAWGPALGSFAAIVVGEIAYGIGIGWLMLRLRHAARDPMVEITLSLVTPYLAFWVPEHLGGSGVLATVATGLYVSWNGPMLIRSATRLQGVFFWELFTYLIEGMVFLLTGLQARTLVERIAEVPAAELLLPAAIVCGVVIVARFVWVFPAVYLPRWLSPSLARRDPSPAWQMPFLLAFTGIRGIVSLAAALAIPLATAQGEPFPHRDLILFLTFFVIVVTLVGQGLLMPSVIRALGLDQAGRRERRRDRAEELARRRQTIEAVMRRLDELAAERNLPRQLVEPLRAHHRERLQQLDYRLGGDAAEQRLAVLSDELEGLLIDAERAHLYQLLCSGELKDDARRRIEGELDLREAHLKRSALRDGEDDA
ncbi:MAG TPA: Na+/H+ antiporter [Myxococcota bacterium]|jgi:CPA1 family monovalent cation:H+ antiporter